MKIGIVSRGNVDDRVYWSGLINVIYHYLKKNKKIKVLKIDKLNNNLRKIYALKREYFKYVKKIKFDESYNKYVSKNFGYQIEKKLNYIKDIDFLLTFDTSLIAYVKTEIPIILWTDMLYSDYYKHYYGKKKFQKVQLIQSILLRKKH